jgi:hypothetical protein
MHDFKKRMVHGRRAFFPNPHNVEILDCNSCKHALPNKLQWPKTTRLRNLALDLFQLLMELLHMVFTSCTPSLTSSKSFCKNCSLTPAMENNSKHRVPSKQENHHKQANPCNLQETKKHKCKEKLFTNPFPRINCWKFAICRFLTIDVMIFSSIKVSSP